MVHIKETWVEAELFGYKPFTNYWEQFTQAESQETEQKAVKACKILLEQLLLEAKSDYKNMPNWY